MRKIIIFGFIAVAILIGFTMPVAHSSPGRQPPTPLLRLHRDEFDAKAVDQQAAIASLAAAPGPYAIIQLHGPVTVADRVALEQTGLKLLEYLPDFAYLVQGTPDQLEAAACLPQVYARTSFTLADKLAPSLLQAVTRGDRDLGQLRVMRWPEGQGVSSQGLQTLEVQEQTIPQLTELLQLAAQDSVRWIEPVTQPRIFNDRARAIMQIEPAWQNRQLFGTGQVIAVADSGLDTGDLTTLSPDFAGRIVATQILSPVVSDWGDNFGHGTHVAGSVAGAGVQSGANPLQHQYTGSFAGIAPEAGLVIQAFDAAADGTVIGLDPDYYQLFAQAYGAGARLHTNSWGDPTGPENDPEAKYGGYPLGAQRTDQFVWEHPDMAIFFAAGNEGVDGTPFELIPGLPICLDGNGVVDEDSLFYPATAKNVITVGAAESNRSNSGLGSLPWFALSLCFGSDPIAFDLIANNVNGMAAFSSRGPTDDGRVKPDIVAPGTNIVSNRSHYPGASTLWGAYETNSNYAYSGGTSMATPLTAGAGVLVRQWLTGRGLTSPSAAAIKAVLLNTTRDIAPGQYGTGSTQEIPFDRPNSVSGWGRVDLGFIDAPPSYTLWVDDHTTGLVTEQVINYTHTATRSLDVTSSSQPLRVMLTWTDPPASLSAAVQLVNDLDLTVTGPDGDTYYGNNVASGDRTNNVEGVVINNPPVGQYQIQVSALNVPVASQPYALAVAGPLGPLGGGPPDGVSLVVTKTASLDPATVGQTISYTYQVTNSGTMTVTDITGSDDKLGTVTFDPNTLGPGQSATGILTYTVQAGDLPGPLLNTVTATGTTAVEPVLTAIQTAQAAVSLQEGNLEIYLPVIMRSSP